MTSISETAVCDVYVAPLPRVTVMLPAASVPLSVILMTSAPVRPQHEERRDALRVALGYGDLRRMGRKQAPALQRLQARGQSGAAPPARCRPALVHEITPGRVPPDREGRCVPRGTTSTASNSQTPFKPRQVQECAFRNIAVPPVLSADSPVSLIFSESSQLSQSRGSAYRGLGALNGSGSREWTAATIRSSASGSRRVGRS